MSKKILLSALIAASAGSAAIAGHANPWSGDDDTVNMQYHEVNLAQSVDTPGEDEMLGELVQSAFGKLGGDLPGADGRGMGGADAGAGNGGPGGGGGNGGPGGRQ